MPTRELLSEGQRALFSTLRDMALLERARHRTLSEADLVVLGALLEEMRRGIVSSALSSVERLGGETRRRLQELVFRNVGTKPRVKRTRRFCG